MQKIAPVPVTNQPKVSAFNRDLIAKLERELGQQFKAIEGKVSISLHFKQVHIASILYATAKAGRVRMNDFNRLNTSLKGEQKKKVQANHDKTSWVLYTHDLGETVAIIKTHAQDVLERQK